jgi:hypothetical protein
MSRTISELDSYVAGFIHGLRFHKGRVDIHHGDNEKAFAESLRCAERIHTMGLPDDMRQEHIDQINRYREAIER